MTLFLSKTVTKMEEIRVYQPHTSAKKKYIYITLKKEIQEEIIVDYKRRVAVDSDIEMHRPIW